MTDRPSDHEATEEQPESPGTEEKAPTGAKILTPDFEARAAELSKDRERLGKALAILRTVLGLSQREVAELIGINQVQMSRAERGRARPDPERLAKIMEALGVGMPQLNLAVSTVGRLQGDEDAPEAEAPAPPSAPGDLRTGLAEDLHRLSSARDAPSRLAARELERLLQRSARSLRALSGDFEDLAGHLRIDSLLRDTPEIDQEPDR